MTESPALAEYRALVTAVEPAARVIPVRVLRRAIRQSRDRGTFRPKVVHDRCWWVRRDDLFAWLTPPELGLSANEPPELLLLPTPDARASPASREVVWRTLFHAAVDRELDAARRDGRLDDDTIHGMRHGVGPSRWQMIRTVLAEEHLIDEADPDFQVFREFAAFGLELVRFRPGDWGTYFPGLSPDVQPLSTARRLLDVDSVYERTRPEIADTEPAHPAHPTVSAMPLDATPDDRALDLWAARGNDLKAAVRLARSGDPRAEAHVDRVAARLAPVLDLDEAGVAAWSVALRPLLRPAAAGGWPPERRLLYQLQRACLAVEQTNYTVSLFEWARTFGRRPLKRPLPKTRWVEAHLRLRAALRYAQQLPGGYDDHAPLPRLIADGVHATERKARDDLRPELVAVLDEVGLVPQPVPEERSKEKLVEELLDGACARGFLRIGDLRDAIARNRVKLPDLRGAGEFVRGDPLIRANELLPVRLDGVYRRGEVYMRLLQRGCSVFFGTRVGRWFSKYVALPFGGAFILLEALGHLREAGAGVVNWLSGWTATVNGVSLLGGGMARTLAENPTLEPHGVGWRAVLALGVFLLLLLHWPAFRARIATAVRFTFVKVPRAIRRSPVVYRIVHNPLTRFFRRHLLLPVAAAAAGAIATWLAGGDIASIGLIAGGMALLAATFFRTPFGREVEDRFDEVMERVWRVVSVNFVVGLITLVLNFFRAVFEAIDRSIHAVDDALRFREGDTRPAFAAKLLFGAGWAMFTYLFRFAWTLLVEPQINPIKHFPVVTVSHKILLPLIPPLSNQFGVAPETMTTIVFGIPGVFGFLVWELKENWKLYRANAPEAIRPIQVGSHGETVRGLLRPGFHSGTVPKAFTKLHRAARSGDHAATAKYRHALEHVAESIHRFGERSFLNYLRASRRWAGVHVALGHPLLAPNRIVLPIELGPGQEPVQLALEERNGWIIGSVPDEGGLRDLTAEQRAAFADAVVGLYKWAGADAVREHVAAAFGPQAYQFDAVAEGLVIPLADGKEQFFDFEDGPEIGPVGHRLPAGAIVLSDRPLLWANWVARWEADAAGKAPTDSLIPGWKVLLNPAG